MLSFCLIMLMTLGIASGCSALPPSARHNIMLLETSSLIGPTSVSILFEHCLTMLSLCLLMLMTLGIASRCSALSPSARHCIILLETSSLIGPTSVSSLFEHCLTMLSFFMPKLMTLDIASGCSALPPSARRRIMPLETSSLFGKKHQCQAFVWRQHQRSTRLCDAYNIKATFFDRFESFLLNLLSSAWMPLRTLVQSASCLLLVSRYYL